MLCYADKTFCNNPGCTNNKCKKKLTDEVKRKADEWWGGPGAPVAVMDFRETCGEFKEEPN